MTPEQQAAFVNAMAVAALIEAMGMVAENELRKQQGHTIAYSEEAFQALVEQIHRHTDILR